MRFSLTSSSVEFRIHSRPICTSASLMEATLADALYVRRLPAHPIHPRFLTHCFGSTAYRIPAAGPVTLLVNLWVTSIDASQRPHFPRRAPTLLLHPPRVVAPTGNEGDGVIYLFTRQTSFRADRLAIRPHLIASFYSLNPLTASL
jgi:hypothetical protein